MNVSSLAQSGPMVSHIRLADEGRLQPEAPNAG